MNDDRTHMMDVTWDAELAAFLLHDPVLEEAIRLRGHACSKLSFETLAGACTATQRALET